MDGVFNDPYDENHKYPAYNLKCGTNVVSPPVVVYGFWNWIDPLLGAPKLRYQWGKLQKVLQKDQSSPRTRRYITLVPHLRLMLL